MIVADASVVVDLLLGPGSPAGDALGASLAANEAVCVPHLIDAEVPQVLRRFVLKGALSGSAAEELVEILVALPFRRYPHTLLASRAFSLRENVSFYDALYLALADSLGCPLLTGDGALATVPGSAVRVVVLPTSRS